MTTSTQQAKQAVGQAEQSGVVEGLARYGLAARGVIYVLVGLLAVQVAVGGGAEADRQGALETVKHQPFGTALLLALVVGFAGYACWRLLEAAAGHRTESGAKRTAKRIASAGRGVVYAGLAATTVRFLTSGPRRDSTRPWVARVMAHPGGQLAVGLVGAAVVVAGLAMAYRGVRRGFLKRLDLATASPSTRTAVTAVGTTGLTGRGLVLSLFGGFLVEAAVTFDPNKAKGLDAALKSLAGQPFGPVLLALAALGLVAFGGWSFVEARYRRL